MSRTYKDRPYKVKKECYQNYYDFDTECISYMREYVTHTNEVTYYESVYWLQKPTTKTKKPKEVDTESHWMSTPSWWTHTFMNKPQRRKGALWEREVVKTQVTNLEEVDNPSVSRKPHIYYW